MRTGGYFLVKKDKDAGVKIGKLADFANFFEKDEVFYSFFLFFIIINCS